MPAPGEFLEGVTMSLPTYTDADIRAQSSADSFQRGREYRRSGAVVSLVQRGATFQAEVSGSDADPYRVQVTFDGNALAGATCTCPYDWGGWCKHIVGTLLAAREQPEKVDERELVAHLLTGLNREQLEALVLKLIQFEPDIIDIVEAQVALLAPTPTTVATSSVSPPQPARPTIDPKALRRQVRSLLGYSGGGRSWRGYDYVGAAVSAVSEVVAQAQQLVEAGAGREALAVLDVLTEEFLTVWEGLDDSDGESTDFSKSLEASGQRRC
jgi:uncharacterized Zn finger protein